MILPTPNQLPTLYCLSWRDFNSTKSIQEKKKKKIKTTDTFCDA